MGGEAHHGLTSVDVLRLRVTLAIEGNGTPMASATGGARESVAFVLESLQKQLQDHGGFARIAKSSRPIKLELEIVPLGDGML